MDTAEALREQIRAYLKHEISLRDLNSWLAAHEIGLHEPLAPAWEELSSRIWAVVAEQDSGLRDEHATRAELDALVSPRMPVVKVSYSGDADIQMADGVQVTHVSETVLVRR